MAVIVAIDPSLTATGVAVWTDGRMVTETIRTRPDDFECPPDRWRHIVGHIYRHLRPGCLSIVEAGFPHAGPGGGRTSLVLAELRAVLLYGLRMRQVPYVLVDNMRLKIYALGRARSTKDKTSGELVPVDKETVLLAARKHDIPATNNNEADAGWLACMATDHYGRPYARMPARNRLILDRMTWPRWQYLGQREVEPVNLEGLSL